MFDYFINYRLADEGLQVTSLGGQVVMREFPYKEMISAKVGYELWNEHWMNRFDLNECVSIRLDRAILPWLVITPDRPADFVARLNQRLAKA